jgi:hypothetical protein
MFKVAALFVAVSSLAFAVDGVILIDQNRALAGNVTPGDAPGYPVTIAQPGSYRLSGKLTAPADVHGIVIAASGVTLDLNGFSIEGPPQNCQGGGFCAPLNAILVSGPRQGITVRNGTTLGFSARVDLQNAAFSLMEGMMLLGSGQLATPGLQSKIGPYSAIRNTTSVVGFLLTCPVAMSDSVTIGFIDFEGVASNTCKLHNTIGQIF